MATSFLHFSSSLLISLQSQHEQEWSKHFLQRRSTNFASRSPLRCVSIVPVLCVCLVLVLEFLESVGRGRGRPYLSFGVTAADGRMASYRGDGESLFQGAAILLRDKNNPKNTIYLIACLLNVSYCIPLLPVLHGMRFS